MPYDDRLAQRIRTLLADRDDLVERRMFGGLAFLIAGNMCCGIVGDDLCLRLGRDGVDAAFDRPHTKPMDFTGKPMPTMVYVEPAGTRTARQLESWVNRALAFVDTLPRKQGNR